MTKILAFIFTKWEYIFFIIYILFFSSSVFTPYEFITLDGPAHLYNAGLIKEIVINPNSWLHDVFIVQLTPNWSGHVILALIQLFAEPILAEKIFVFAIIIFFCLAFRKFVFSINYESVFISYSSVFLAFNALIFLGFYNFFIATSLLLFSLSYRDLFVNHKVKSINLFLLLVLACLTLLSHVFSFLLLISLLYLYITFSILTDSKFKSFFEALKFLLKRIFFLSLILSVPIYSAIYFLTRPLIDRRFVFLSWDEISDWYFTLRPFYFFNKVDESEILKLVGFLILLFLLIVSLKLIKSFKSLLSGDLKINNETKLLNKVFWFGVLVLMIVLAYFLPDSDRYAGFVTLRMVYLSCVFFFIFLSSFQYPLYFKIITICIICVFTGRLREYQDFKMNELSPYIQDIVAAGERIPGGEWVLFYSVEDNWLMRHFSSYLVAGTDNVVLDNYEVDANYFPLMWDKEKAPKLFVGKADTHTYPCFKWISNENNPIEKVGYVVIFGNVDSVEDSCELEMIKNVKLNYKMIFENKSCSVFKIW